MSTTTLRVKVLTKCDCGEVVVPGSVFCPCCQLAVQIKNARMIKAEENTYQKMVRGKGTRD